MNTLFIQKKISESFNWNLLGSIFYEITKTINQTLLFYCLTSELYSIIGITFSLIYCAARFADVGGANALAPLYTKITASKTIFKYIILHHFLLPMIPVCIIVTSLALWYGYTLNLTLHYNTNTWIFLTSSIIALEAVRNITRTFLHLSFFSRRIVILELCSYACYLTSTWMMILFYKASPSLFLFTHFLDSLFVVIMFIILSFKIYQKLPTPLNSTPPRGLYIHGIKVTNYFLRISKDIFSNNALTTMVGFWFGVENIGSFFFVSNAATSTQSIIKSCITYPGSAFLAHIKEGSITIKRTAFLFMANKLLLLLTPCSAFCITHYSVLKTIWLTQNPISHTFLFFIITIVFLITDLFFLLYEQFYLVEESALRLAMLKCIEFAILFIIITNKNYKLSTTNVLMGIVIAKVCTTLIIATDAYAKWKIRVPIKKMIYYSTTWIIIFIIIKKINFINFLFS